MDAFPAFFPLAGRTIAIVGEGAAAESKLRLFDGSPARVVRVEDAKALKPKAYDGGRPEPWSTSSTIRRCPTS
jgi:precorrin-2 dehydrogenase / sirohydrochlorin ferrochelatase